MHTLFLKLDAVMSQSGVTSVEDYEWLRQMRYYYNTADTAAVCVPAVAARSQHTNSAAENSAGSASFGVGSANLRIGNYSTSYGYEYSGG